MVPEDLEQCARLVGRGQLAQLRPSRILLLSPSVEQYRLFKRVYPSARLHTSDRFLWDLSQRRDWHFDLIFAGNVMHYSPAPATWFANILRSCRFFLVQDLVNRRRANPPGYLHTDGDAVRYQYKSRGVVSEFPGAFDLVDVTSPCLEFETYRTSTGALHFVALFQGAAQAVAPSTRLSPDYAVSRLLTAWVPLREALRHLIRRN